MTRKPELTISEFTFAYNFLHEQQTIFKDEMIATPILPSLHEEAGVGFDACLPTRAACFIYQFKKSRYIVRSNARRRNRDPPPYPAPFYRFALRQKGNYHQHFLLKAWSELYPCTFYVAPEMHDNQTFFQAARAGEIWKKSRFVFLNLCQEDFTGTSTDQHFIEYKEGQIQPLICSNHGYKLEKSLMGDQLREYYLSQKLIPIEDLTMKLFHNTIDFIAKNWGVEHTKKLGDVPFSMIPQKREIAKSLQLSSNILSSYLGVTPVLFGERRS